mmetsp:Transcript_14637/g.25293  ORF Transcript_14637/g.25293 Transcript_14637/m.25293 type:complete len:298 (-) Transcript_14637:604-1497(-)
MSYLDELVTRVYTGILYPFYLFCMLAIHYVNEHVVIPLWMRMNAQRLPLINTCVLVGDGISMGIGDHISRGGLASRVRVMLREQGKQDFKIMLPWRILSRGKVGATTKDWLPVPDRQGAESVSESQPSTQRQQQQQQSNLFTDTFVKGDFGRPDVVVLFLGSEDMANNISPKQTLENLKAITSQLLALGVKKVLVATCAYMADRVDDQLEREHAERNRLITQWVEKETGNRTGIFEGPDLMKVVNQGEMLIEFGGSIMFTDAAFRQLTPLLMDALRNPMKQVEWPKLVNLSHAAGML